MIVLDAGAGLAALLGPGAARDALGVQQVHVPHLADSEVVHALRRLVASGDLTADVGTHLVDTWSRLGLTRHPAQPSLARVWELRANLTAYDATYVALAESLACALLTTDARLARAPGPRCPITVLPR